MLASEGSAGKTVSRQDGLVYNLLHTFRAFPAWWIAMTKRISLRIFVICCICLYGAASSHAQPIQFNRDVRPILADTGPVRCEATVVHRGRRVATAEGRLIADATGKLLAHGTTTCLIEEAKG